MKLRSHILLISGAILVPLFVFLSLVVVLLFQKGREARLESMVSTARALSLAVDKNFEIQIAVLQTLAHSQHLQAERLRAFYDESQGILLDRPSAEAILLVDPDGQQRVNTRQPFDTDLPRYGDQGFIRQIASSRKPAVSSLFTGSLIQRPVLSIGIPVVMNQQVKYVLTMSFAPSFIQQLLERQNIPPDEMGTIIDANKAIIARTKDIYKFLGEPATPQFRAKSSATAEGWWTGTPYGGPDSYVAHHRSEFSGWTVGLAVPVAEMHAALWQSIGTVVGGMILFTLAAFGIAAIYGRRILSSITALAEGAKTLGTGAAVKIRPSPIAELDHVRREMEAAAAKRKEVETALRESETRLKTIVDSEPECVKVLSPDGRVLEMNPAGLQMLQANSLAQIKGKNLLDFITPEHSQAFRELHRRVIGGEAGTLAFEVVGLQGARRWLQTNAVPLRDAEGQVTALLGVTRDVTDRKRVEEELRYELQLIKSITDNAAVAIFVGDADGRNIFVNPKAEKMFGFTAEEMRGRSVHEMIHHHHPDGRPLPHSECPLGRSRRAGVAIQNHQDVFFRKDGSHVIVECTEGPVEIDGKPIGAVLITRDITQRKQAEDALIEQTAKLREQASLLDLAHDAIVARRLDGTITFWNRGAREMYGWTAQEAVGRISHDLLKTEFPCPLSEIEFELMRTDRWEGELIHSRRDGTRVLVASRWALQRSEQGQPSAIMEINNDITMRKQAETALHQSEERLQLALTASRMGVWERDLQTDRVFWSPECYEIFGVKDFAQTRGEFIRLVHPEDIDRVFEAADRAVADRQLYNVEYRAILPNGEVRWLANMGRAEYDAAGRPLRMIGTVVDITERKRLLAEVQERAAQLAEADRRKNEFLAMLAHELRNPLAPVTNAVEILRMSGLSSPGSLKAVDIIDDQMTHMTRLIDDLLDISRITRGTLELRKKRIDLAQVMAGAVDGSRPLIERSGLQLIVSLPPEPLPLDADSVRLTQALSNLLNNAAKFTDCGGSITLSAERRENEAVVRVRDTGVGIPPDRLGHIFELFAQLNNSLERAQGGLGIGLTLVKQLVEMHGGSVAAGSEGLGKGSEFVIRLPLAAEPLASPVAPAPPAALSSEEASLPLRILVADDNLAAADTIATILKWKGNTVKMVHDGEEALATAAEFCPDVALLDLGMPKINGYDVCRRLREQPSGRRLLIVALTGWGREEDRQLTRYAGFDYHLVKPVRPTDLIKLIAELTAKRESGAATAPSG